MNVVIYLCIFGYKKGVEKMSVRIVHIYGNKKPSELPKKEVQQEVKTEVKKGRKKKNV